MPIAYHGSNSRLTAISSVMPPYLWTTDQRDDRFLICYPFIHQLAVPLADRKSCCYLSRKLSDRFLEGYASFLGIDPDEVDEEDDLSEPTPEDVRRQDDRESYLSLEGALNDGLASLSVDFWSIGDTRLPDYVRSRGYHFLRLDRSHPWMCILDVTNVTLLDVVDNDRFRPSLKRTP
jgi:hypothetical protein